MEVMSSADTEKNKLDQELKINSETSNNDDSSEHGSRRLNDDNQNNSYFQMAYSFDGIIAFVLLTICTCGYMRRVPKLREWFFLEKK
ncbi:unnamed protein product, partial [Rotaria socialis]